MEHTETDDILNLVLIKFCPVSALLSLSLFSRKNCGDENKAESDRNMSLICQAKINVFFAKYQIQKVELQPKNSFLEYFLKRQIISIFSENKSF